MSIDTNLQEAVKSFNEATAKPEESKLDQAVRLLVEARCRIANLSLAAHGMDCVPFDHPIDGPVLKEIDAFLATMGKPILTNT